jgi:hypothetical protein
MLRYFAFFRFEDSPFQVGSQFKDNSRGLPNGLGGQILGRSAGPENLRGRHNCSDVNPMLKVSWSVLDWHLGIMLKLKVECWSWRLNHHKVSCWCWRSLIMNHRNIDCNVNSMLNVNSCWSWKSLNHRNQSQINSDKKITTLSSICSWRPASFQRGPVEYANNYQRTGRGLWSRASRASVFVCSPI